MTILLAGRSITLAVFAVNRLLASFVPLLLAVQDAGTLALPRILPHILAVLVWSLPDLMLVNGALAGERYGSQVYRIITRAIKRGYVTLGVGIGAGALIHRGTPRIEWWMIGFCSFVGAIFVEQWVLQRGVGLLQRTWAEPGQ